MNNTATLEPTPIRTHRVSVSQRIIEYTHLLFNQSPKTIFHELLQNSRRAGATLVEITLAPEEGGHKITITDNGSGLPEPDPLFKLAETGWSENIKTTETPAGMGLFSLCHLPQGFSARSKSWQVHLTPDSFTGKLAIPEEDAPYIEGMEISFFHPTTEPTLESIITTCAQYYPIPVTINGEKLVQESLHKDAHYTYSGANYSIGIKNSYDTVRPVLINFHGLTISTCKTTLLPEDFGYRAQVDLENTQFLDLVLPARNAIVKNEKLRALQRQCRFAVYQYIHHRNLDHLLPFEYYQEAHSMGFPIKEAIPKLKLIRPEGIWDFEQGWDKDECYQYPPQSHAIPVKPTSFVTETISSHEIAAISLSGNTIPPIYEANPKMTGYSWYPKNIALSLTTTIKQTIDGKESIVSWTNPNEDCPLKFKPTDKTTHAETITLTLNYLTGTETKGIEIPTFIAFNSSLDSDTGLAEGWLPTKDAKGRIDAETLRLLFFCEQNYDRSSDCDSYNTQLESFDNAAEGCLIEVYETEEKARFYALQQALIHYKILNAIASMNLSSFTCTIDSFGHPIITSTAAQSEAEPLK